MNSANRKYHKIVSVNSGFKGSVNTVNDDIIAMVDKLHTHKKCKQVYNDNDTDDNPSDKKS